MSQLNTQVDEDATEIPHQKSQLRPPVHKFFHQGSILSGHLRPAATITADTVDAIDEDITFDPSAPCAVGIDEAGRGPVLGPMVYGSCLVNVEHLPIVKSLKVNDSKQVKKNDRLSLFDILQDQPYISWLVDSIHPRSLSADMLRQEKISLNAISHDSAIRMVSLYIAKGYNVQELYVDTVGDADKYAQKLSQIFPSIGKVVVCPKADALHPIVSAASICAKETRDAQVDEWKCVEALRGVDIQTNYGPGYPGGTVTKAWLRDHIDPVFGFPDIVRFSWSTAEKLIVEHCVEATWGDDEKVLAKHPPLSVVPDKVAKDEWVYQKRNHIEPVTQLPL